MNDTDINLMYKRMGELNINLIQLGKDINALRKTQQDLTKKVANLPKEVFTAASKVASKATLDDFKCSLAEIVMTTNDTQKTVDTLLETFTKEKAID